MTTVCRSALVAALVGGLAALPSGAFAQGQGGSGGPPPSVVVAPVVAKAVAEQGQFTGRVQAIQSVDVQARVEGYLEEVAFEEGSNVKTGDLLYQIEQGPYQAALAQAQAQLASAKAQLSSAQANLNNQEINLKRQQTLVQRDTVSQAVVDDAVASRDAAQADVEAAQAAIQNAQAQIQTAELNLSYTTIKAPIDGRLGRTNVTIGNLVSQASGTMATLVQLDPIRVAFSVPDTTYTTLVEQTQLQTNAKARDLFKPTLQLPNGKTYQQPGKISFASNEIDPSTGTITAYADFPNPTAILLPGAFVVVNVAQAQENREPVIPASAVVQDRQGEYVFVINENDVAETRRVTLGRRTASEVAVTEGLSEGETIVVQGVQKIRPGEKVTPTPLKSDAIANPSSPLTASDDPGASVTSGDNGVATMAPGQTSGSGGTPAGDASSGNGAATTGGGAPASGGTPASDANAGGSGASGAAAPASGGDTSPAPPSGASDTSGAAPAAGGASATDTSAASGDASTTPADPPASGGNASADPPAASGSANTSPPASGSDANAAAPASGGDASADPPAGGADASAAAGPDGASVYSTLPPPRPGDPTGPTPASGGN